MSLELTFKDVCKTIKKQGKEDPKLIEAVDNLLGLALICSPVVLGPAAAALLPTLAIKNEVIKIGKSVFEKFTKKKDEDYLLRYETMSTAYGLLVFTSFFDALDARLPETLRKEISLVDAEKAFLVRDAVGKAASPKPAVPPDQPHDAPVSTLALSFPHPTETLDEQSKRHAKIWKQMGQGFVEFVHNLALWDAADEKKKATLVSGLEKIEDEAAKRFDAQYFELARKFEDFAIWANLQSHKGTKTLMGELSEYVRRYAKLSAGSEKAIDVGFNRLREAVLSIPETLRIQQASEIADSLNRHYQARVNEPIIEDKEMGEENAPRLSFPKVSEAFVPQAFRVLRQTGKSRRLEDESTWSGLPRRNDLGAFLLSYLSSPYSTDTPLLILGHPGSGKSLLTTILSAQLMSKQFTAIRVPLREVDADADIVTQIEEAIRRITGVSFDSWIKLSALFKNCPPLVLLDGYDELLQASGQVFASYIKDAQRFQEREAEQARPLRIIITSRVTLIDKASVPVGSTIVRLLEFDRFQRECWSGIWNRANASYFRDARIEKFALPSEKEKGAEKILNLAEQPLLLLMLALYDSQENQLRNSRGLDRTKLYDSLLRRFVIRERGKEKGFNDSQSREREKALSTEMQRLGVAALGMYNRRKVHILAPELDDDLAFFKLEREVATKPGKALSQADLLLGSFFFVHKSKAQHTTGAEDTHEETAAFEFLHNTFGEFLTADFIVRRAVSQVQALRAAESNEALKSIIDKMLGTADGFERDWFASLVYTPLFTRPVVMEMIREWTPHVLRDYGVAEADFVETLEQIVLNQIKRLLNKREMPQIMRKETAQEGYRVPFGDHPLMGHVAIYSINLVLLRLVAGKQPFLFDECEVTSHEDGTRPWDRLMHIWRSWFSLGNLNGLTAVMVAHRNESKIKVSAKSKFQAEEAKSKLHEYHNVALSLGDNVSAGISGFCLFNPTRDQGDEIHAMLQRLSSEGYELGVAGSIAELLVLAERFLEAPKEFVAQARQTLEQAMQSGRRDQLENVCLIISRTLVEGMHGAPWIAGRGGVFRDLLDPRFAIEIAMREPRAARLLFDLGKQLNDFEWLSEFSNRFFEAATHELRRFMMEAGVTAPINFLRLVRDIASAGVGFRDRRVHPDFFDRILDPRHLLELSERNPEAALAYLQILQELGGGRYFERFVEREMESGFFDRMLDPRHLLELSERNPAAALAYLQILRELGGGKYFERFAERHMGSEFFDRMFHPRRLLELSERNPEVALAYVQILRELGGGGYFERFVEMEPRFFERMFHPRDLLELSERNPEAALAYLQILQALGGGRYFERFGERHMGPEFFDRIFHPRHLLELSERNPELALTYLQILSELGGRRYLERFAERHMGPELFDRIFRPHHQRSDRRISSLTVWLTFARILDSKQFSRALLDALFESSASREIAKIRLSLLPISSLADLRSLCEQTKNTELQEIVSELSMPRPQFY